MEFKTVSRWAKIPDYDDPNDMTTGLLEFSDEKCDRCLICTSICPARSILIDKDGPDWKKGLPYLDSVAEGVTACVACGCCLAACPHDAITIKRGFCSGHYFVRLTQAKEMTYPCKY